MNVPRQSNHRLLPATILGLSLSVGLIGASLILSHGAQQVAAARESISVKGTAEKQVTADRAQWITSLSVQAPTIAEGLQQLQAQTEQVVNALAADNLVGDQKFELSAWSSEPVYQRLDNGYDGALVGYKVTRQIGIVLGDVQKPATLNTRVDCRRTQPTRQPCGLFGQQFGTNQTVLDWRSHQKRT